MPRGIYTRTKKQAVCHPERPYKAKGLCDSCYTLSLVYRNDQTYAQKLEYQKKYYHSHPAFQDKATLQSSNWRKANPERYSLINLKRSLKKRNMTRAQYDAMFKLQNGRCAVCQRTAEEADTKRRRLCIDHDHTTQIVRGLLCGPCNQALGLLRESSDVIKRALDYLTKE